MREAYTIAADEVIDETIVSRSRFICYLSPCSSNEQAKTFVKSIAAQHPNANHHCYAFVTGHPLDSQKYGFSDDGEPAGTAGRPMLSALQGSMVGELVAVVVRYFGGTKLGTGGLQRAYGGSVRQALALLTTKVKIPMVHKALACQYTEVDDVSHALKTRGGHIVEQDYGEQVKLVVAIPDNELSQFAQQLNTLSSGKICLTSLD